METHLSEEKVNEPTKIKSNSSTYFDNIFVNIQGGNAHVTQPHLSDHCAQNFQFELIEGDGLNQSQYYYSRVYSILALKKFNDLFEDINWDELYKSTDNTIYNMWNNFSNHFESAFGR